MNKVISIFFVVLALFSTPLKAGNPVVTKSAADSTKTAANYKLKLKTANHEPYKFNAAAVAIPGAMITLGAVGCATSGIIYDAKVNIRHEMEWLRKDTGYLRFDDYVQYVPNAAYLTLGFIPNLGKNDFAHRTLALATSWVSLGVITNILKYTVREMRPDGSARNSFPSGHTATAFMGAELIRIEYGWGIGAGAYAVAAGVAFMRLYNNKHWINDIVAGAGIGILSANIGYWLLPYTEKILPKKWRYNYGLAITPQSSFPGSMEMAICLRF